MLLRLFFPHDLSFDPHPLISQVKWATLCYFSQQAGEPQEIQYAVGRMSSPPSHSEYTQHTETALPYPFFSSLIFHFT